MEENNGIGGVVSDERILMLVRRDESYSEIFWCVTSRGNSSEDKIYGCRYAICESGHAPFFTQLQQPKQQGRRMANRKTTTESESPGRALTSGYVSC